MAQRVHAILRWAACLSAEAEERHEDGPHTIRIIPNGDGNVPIKALGAHRPALRSRQE
jgi:hypothetical protein